MQSRIRWGILGAGAVARDFVQGLRCLPDAELLAVASRTHTSAQEFSRLFAVPHVHKSYEDLVNDRDIDVVYIATPNHRHKDHSLLCLEAGKPVLCEKPFTVRAAEAREVIALARRKHLFCMEAMWMRFLPLMARLRGLLDANAIGEVRMMTADLGFPAPFDKNNRFFNRELGGGAMLDLGVYPLSLTSYLFGKPSQVLSQASLGPTGVDEQSAAILTHPQGELVILSASLRTHLPCEALIIGTGGQIRIHSPLYRPYKLSLAALPGPTPHAAPEPNWRASAKNSPLLRALFFRFEGTLGPLLNRYPKTIVQAFAGNGYNYEAAEVMRCLRAGELESKIMPLDETLSIMETMDAIRRQWDCGSSYA